MRNIFIFKIFFLSFIGFSQTISNDFFGFSSGVILNFGTHVNSVGLSLRTYYSDYFYQVNIGSTLTWNFTSYGTRKKYWESRSYLGGLLLGGIKNNTIDFQLDGVTHQTKFKNALGYNYIWYFDNSGTSQLSGGWSLHLNKVGIYFENDVFGGQAKDRFRTGNILFSYRYKEFKFGTGVYLWTGETDGTVWDKTFSKDCPNGFKCLDKLPFGKTSHGIWYGSSILNLPYGQNAHFKIGMDSENIRNSVQNRFVHDLILLPKGIERKTPHYPRLDQQGLPTFDKNNCRKNKLFIQTGINENWSN